MIDGKLTGTIKWFCSGSNELCNAAIKEMNDLVMENDDFLNIKNELTDNAEDAHLVFSENTIRGKNGTMVAGYWSGSEKRLLLSKPMLNDNNFSRYIKHEFGHSLGLDHMDNDTKNFMSYYGLRDGGQPNNVSFKLTQYQKDSLMNAYSPKRRWW